MTWVLEKILLLVKYGAPIMLLVGLCYEFYLQKIPAKSQTYKKLTTGKYIALLIAGVLGLLALGYDDWDRSKKEAHEQIYREQQGAREDAFRKEQRAREVSFSQQLTNISAVQTSVASKYDKILMSLATNSTPNATLIASLTSAKEQSQTVDAGIMDLKAWAAELQNARDLQVLQNKKYRMKQFEDNKAIMGTCLPIWDYTVKQLLAMLAEFSRQQNLKCDSHYGSMPNLDVFCHTEEESANWNSFPVATATLGTNITWCYQVTVSKINAIREVIGDRDHAPRLTIECRSSGSTNILQVGSSWSKLSGSAISPPIIAEFSTSNFKKTVDGMLRILIAADTDALGLLDR